MSPFRHLAAFFLFAFTALALASGYWSLIEREPLIDRQDNPRQLIAFDRIQRGRILDRNGATLAESTGQPGDYTRLYPEPSAAHGVGYASFRYGLSGIESAADSILRGEAGLSDLEKWWRYDLLGQPQIGNDVQLTLDINLQRAAFDALGDHAGAVIVVDAHNGDILALTSSPTFDAAQLELDFESIAGDDAGPLFNRATLGLYPPGTILKLFPPTLDLAAAPELPILTRVDPNGEKVTPLQMALLAAAVAGNGEMPAPRLIDAVQSPSGWGEQPASGHPIAILPPGVTDRLRAKFEISATTSGLPMPGYTATAPTISGGATIGWFVGYTPDGKRAMCVVLEDANGTDAALAAGEFMP